MNNALALRLDIVFLCPIKIPYICTVNVSEVIISSINLKKKGPTLWQSVLEKFPVIVTPQTKH